MSYEHKSRLNNRILPLSIKIMFMMIAVVLFLHFIFPNLISRISTAIASPFWSLETGIRSNYLETNSILENAIISNLNKENEELKNILGRKASSSPMILGGIIKKPPFTAYDVYIVDVGGSVVRVGNKVYVKGGVLVGEVVEVNGRYVKVKLYSSYGEKYDVLIGKSSIQATATGQGGGSFEVILPRESNVFINDEVLIPNLSPSVFGIVKSIDIESAGTFSVILFSQPINIYEQKWVQIDNLD